MYDPTIFDNLKVALENQLYDYEAIEEMIEIHDREDVMDFAVLARKFVLVFVLKDKPEIEASLILRAGVKDLAGEIMDLPNSQPGCTLALRFTKACANPDDECPAIEHVFGSIWEGEIELSQTVSYTFGERPHNMQNTIDAVFQKRLTEENMNEMPVFLQHVMDTLHVLNRLQEGA
ncbi:hypothetical protein NCCP2716_21840 [Sporosarcina sp. NCCP-2716]|uniref:hypothetical protein n=1 Tax=Sporosarcina sp. NCCP-2716 TaxID=2943679 RepID=UPI00203F6229|nr:hypothetical protein [Sporosarcina sp. NCCP-2716]GKV69686.1 hypothetical protein NCCP2716_21840 [Sporosarcina sp. NCCP-2716]